MPNQKPTTTAATAPATSPTAASDPWDPGFWQGLYDSGGDRWELGRPAPPLLALFDQEGPVSSGTAIVPGCGRGHEVLLLAALGYSVTGVDLAPAAIEALTAQAAERSLAGRVQAVLGDFLARPALIPDAAYDLWIEHTCFCAIDPSQRETYVATAARAVRGGGRLVGLIWNCGAPAGPPWNTEPDELRERLAADFEMERFEPAQGSVESRKGEWLLVARRRLPK